MLLPCLLKILEKSESVREGYVRVWEREKERERTRELCKQRDLWVEKKWCIHATCHCVWNTTCPLLVSSDSSWDRSTQRLGGILWERSFICAFYVCCRTTWISVLCISLTHRKGDVVKLHSSKHDRCTSYCCCFLVSRLKHTLSQRERVFERLRVILWQRKHIRTKNKRQKKKKQVLSLEILPVQTAMLKFCYER